MASPNQITVSQLNRKIGTPDLPLLVDVCLDEDFQQDPRLIPTAIRHRYDRIEELISRVQNRKVIVICQKGLKLSSGAAAILRSEGIEAEYLEGGNLAWRAAGYPTVHIEKLFEPRISKPSLWVTRNRPKVDRIACPWFIRRFVDPMARFLFVPAGDVFEVAEKYQAIAFDHEDAFWSHKGDKCTFDILLEESDIRMEALAAVSKLVRGADTNQLDLAPEVAGLLAISLGLSRMYKNDLHQLEAGMTVYDALFRWARDAQGETHDWRREMNRRARHA